MVPLILLLASIGLGLVSGCSSVTSNREPTKPLTRVEVTHLGGHWQVRITLPKPVQRYVFGSSPQVRIRERWTVQEDGLELVAEGPRDVVQGQLPFSQFTLEVPADTRIFSGAYQLSQQLGEDQGWLLYLGHFLGGEAGECPEGSALRPPCAQETRYDYVIRPMAGERLWWRGQVTDAVGRWTTDDQANAFAYFGPLLPEQVGQVQWLIPDDFPDWIVDATKKAMPEFMARLTEFYGQPIEGNLRIAMNQAPGDGSYQASVLRDFIQFEFRGERWREPDERALNQILELLAHETVHLWNGGRYRHDHKTGHSWLHEGSATAAASLLMLERGMSLNEFFATRSDQLNNCLSAAQIPLKDLGSRRRFPLYYACGAMIELLIQGALKRRGLDGFAHWRHIYGNLDDNEYSLETFLDSVSATTKDQALADWIGTWAEQGLPEASVLSSRLRSYGLLLKDGPSGGDWVATRSLVRPLMQNDCAGSFSISIRKNVLTLHGIDRCEQSREDFVVESVAGFSVPEFVDLAYDAMQELCQGDGIVPVQGQVAGDEVIRNYGCEKPPVYYRILGWGY